MSCLDTSSSSNRLKRYGFILIGATPDKDLYDGLYYVWVVTHVLVHLEKRHENNLRFHRVVVQNKINDLGHYRYYKHECLDQVHNK